MPEYTDCVNQKIKGGAASICPTCVHHSVCKVIDNQPCIECSQFIRAADVRKVKTPDQITLSEATQALIDFINKCVVGQSYLVTPNGTELITDWGYFCEGLELLNEMDARS